MSKKKPELTPQHERFADEYVVSLNATTAYQRAYPGCAYSTANANGSRLLVDASIRAAIKTRQAELRKRNNCEADRLIQECMRIAFADIEDVMDLSDRNCPRLRERDEMNPETRRAIQEITKTKDGVRVKMASKDAALDKLFRHLGLYAELPPVEVLLAALPPDINAAVKKAIASHLDAQKEAQQ